MPGPDGKRVLLDVGGVLLPTPWELLEDFDFDRRAAELRRLLGTAHSWPEVTRALFQTPTGLAVRPEGRALVAEARAAGRRTGLLTSKLVAYPRREVVERSEFLGSFDLVRRRLGLVAR